jgi:hypothetical protein
VVVIVGDKGVGIELTALDKSGSCGDAYQSGAHRFSRRFVEGKD